MEAAHNRAATRRNKNINLKNLRVFKKSTLKPGFKKFEDYRFCEWQCELCDFTKANFISATNYPIDPRTNEIENLELGSLKRFKLYGCDD